MNIGKRLFGLVMALLCFAVLTSCASQTTVADENKAIANMRSNYRSAALVARGKCVSTHIDGNGMDCSDVSISEVIAGSAQYGDVVHCPNSRMQQGQSYLLYLGRGGDVDYAEDERGYTLINSMPVDGDAVKTADGLRLSYRMLRNDMRELSSVVSAYESYYYYSDADQLVYAADEIFIGRVDGIGEQQDMGFHVSGAGSSSEFTLPTSVVEVTAFGNMKGSLRYGDTVKLVYSSAFSMDVIDASTLKAVNYGETDTPKLQEGGVYVFFLKHSPDEKQDYMFLINPMQGFVKTEEDAVSVSYVNRALLRYDGLNDLVSMIRESILAS